MNTNSITPKALKEANDFRDECDAIYELVATLTDAQLETSTLFKSWSINDILAHLHIWNIAAQLTLTDPDGFVQFGAFAMGHISKGESHIEMQNTYLEGLKGQALVKAWRDYYNPMADNFLSANPQARLKWVGPDMSTRSCIIARQMEHWAHAQAIFDVLGVERKNSARLKNIAHIGVTTYSWSFKVNNLEPLLPKPFIQLKAPGGEIWEWNEPQDDNSVKGSATEFCQVVTQCRNIADTAIETIGENAAAWMSIAQCFAGGPETPPAPGTRNIAK